MNTQQLAEMKRRTYRAVSDDGIADLLLGALIVSFGFAVSTDVDFLPAVVFVLAVPSWKALRKRVVEPRVGYVRLHTSQVSSLKQRKWILSTVLALLVVALWAVTLLIDKPPSRLHELRLVVIGLVLAGPIAVGGYLFDIKRLFAYAGIVMLASLLTLASGLPDGIGLFVSGGLIASVGLFLLSRLIGKNPVRRSEGNHEV